MLTLHLLCTVFWSLYLPTLYAQYNLPLCTVSLSLCTHLLAFLHVSALILCHLQEVCFDAVESNAFQGRWTLVVVSDEVFFYGYALVCRLALGMNKIKTYLLWYFYTSRLRHSQPPNSIDLECETDSEDYTELVPKHVGMRARVYKTTNI
jgi:hypothetical protein